MIRVHGVASSNLGELVRRKAVAFRKLGRLDKAKTAAMQCLKICQDSEDSNGYIEGLQVLSEIVMTDGKLLESLKYIEEARSLFLPNQYSPTLGCVLSLQATILTCMERFEEALIVMQKDMDFELEFRGPNHPQYAHSCMTASQLYCRLKQFNHAITLAKMALSIFMNIHGSAHRDTQSAMNFLFMYERALTNTALNNQLASKSRLCNHLKCGNVKKNMNRCLSCLSHYLCQEHEELIHEHVVVCPKFPDVLPDEEKQEKIIKCRRCRKQTKLMKCGVCEKVSYCGATCQKDDWKRHKLFCGKK